MVLAIQYKTMWNPPQKDPETDNRALRRSWREGRANMDVTQNLRNEMSRLSMQEKYWKRKLGGRTPGGGGIRGASGEWSVLADQRNHRKGGDQKIPTSNKKKIFGGGIRKGKKGDTSALRRGASGVLINQNRKTTTTVSRKEERGRIKENRVGPP